MWLVAWGRSKEVSNIHIKIQESQNIRNVYILSEYFKFVWRIHWFMIGCLTYWSKNRKEGNWLPLELVSAHQKTNVSSEGDATNKYNMYINISLTRLLESNKFVNSYTVAGILGRWTWIEFWIYFFKIEIYHNE